MGCGIAFLDWLSTTGKIPRTGRLLDIGESCLDGAEPEQLKNIVRRHGGRMADAQLDKLLTHYSFRSKLSTHPTIPTLFLGELLALTEVEYVSLDVVSARAAELFDLNVHSLRSDKRATFDIAVNFGTTEHLINQFNAFKVMHEAVKPGGHMFHQVPSTGYINHGYFCYNALMFEELAQANCYDIVDLWFYGPNGDGNVLTNGTKHSGVLDSSKLHNNVELFQRSPVPNSLINVLYCKREDRPFRVALEVKTAAGKLPTDAVYTSEYIETQCRQDGPHALFQPAFVKRILRGLSRRASTRG